MIVQILRIGFAASAFFLAVSACFGQAVAKTPDSGKAAADAVSSSPAYAELLLRRTDLTAELESLLIDYTDDYPKVKELRYTLDALKLETERLRKVKPADSGRLTLALGRLIVRKVELETDVWNLLRTYKDEHPDVKRAKRKVDIYEAAIKEILG